MSKIIGIDLGTTYSGVAVVRDRRPQMLPHGEERIIPSVVGYSAEGKWLVGTPARNQYVYDPENTVRSIKREMGSDYRVRLGGREFSPPEISAFILRHLKEIAERNLNQEVTDAVITVPAYFSDAQRQATRDAGRIAGLNVRRIINEPTAAALAYGLNLEEDQLVLVYDLGGGTFDVSLVELMGGIVEVRASHGNTRLGGDDFDQRLASMVADRFQSQHGIDLQSDRRTWARLLRAAESAKIALSDHPFAWLKEEYLAEKDGVPLHLEMEIGRHEFEEVVDDLLRQTLDSIEQVLADAGVDRGDISQVLLVGGSTRIPAVWDLITEAIGIEPQMAINPDEAVALGAGVQAAIIAGEPIDAILVDVTPHSLGIAVADLRLGQIIPDRYRVLIHRNTTIPVTKEDLFSTVFPDQDTIHIQVYQGERPVASQNTLLGDFFVRDLKPAVSGEHPQITVNFDFDVDGILHVTARDRQTAQEEEITVEASLERLGEADVEGAQSWLAEAVADITQSPLPAETGALVQRAEHLLKIGDLDDGERGTLSSLIRDIRAAHAEGNEERLESLTEALLDALFDYE